MCNQTCLVAASMYSALLIAMAAIAGDRTKCCTTAERSVSVAGRFPSGNASSPSLGTSGLRANASARMSTGDLLTHRGLSPGNSDKDRSGLRVGHGQTVLIARDVHHRHIGTCGLFDQTDEAPSD